MRYSEGNVVTLPESTKSTIFASRIFNCRVISLNFAKPSSSTSFPLPEKSHHATCRWWLVRNAEDFWVHGWERWMEMSPSRGGVWHSRGSMELLTPSAASPRPRSTIQPRRVRSLCPLLHQLGTPETTRSARNSGTPHLAPPPAP